MGSLHRMQQNVWRRTQGARLSGALNLMFEEGGR